MKFWYQENDTYIGQRVALDKYETYERKLMLRQVNSGSIVVDVGANIGYYTLLLAQKCRKVYAIEPEKNNFEILAKNVAENNLDNVVLLNVAAGSRSETRRLVRDEDNFGNHRLSSGKGNIVEVVKLDEILKDEQKIDLIKIDTQGWEPEVIMGAIKIIARDSPTLFLEYWPEGIKEAGLDGERMWKQLRKRYKNIWQINDKYNIYHNVKEGNINDKQTGYADMWLKNNATVKDSFFQISNLKIKTLIKAIIKYGNDKKN